MEPSSISVTFIDDASATTMAARDLPVANLPETFELETTLHLGDDDWTVVSAQPPTKLEFTGSGRLVLRLRKVEKVNLSDFLYSLPSICDRLPAVANTPPGADDLILAEDDWRQFELVSRVFAGGADAEIAAIRAIHENESAGVGWKKIHVRKRPDPPIASTLGRADINRTFGGVTFRGVSLAGSPVVAGFSFRSGTLQCYGVEEDRAISVLGIAQEAAGGEAIEALTQIAHEFDLDLVHWCRCARVEWCDPLFRQLLEGGV
jgi:hypothetical protein